MKYDGYFLVSDFDGTLVNSSQHVSKENKAAIQYFTENGGLFCGATGRTQFSIRPYMIDLPLNCPWILYNGACLYDFQEDRAKKIVPVNKEPLRAILKRVMHEIPQICIHLFTEDTCYLINPNGIEDKLMLREEQDFVYGDMDAITKPWIKALLHEEHEVLKEVQKLVMAEDKEKDFHVFFSIGTYLEITGSRVSKGFALELLKKEYGERIRKVIAIGDYHNDLEMLQKADIKAAPANAHPEVKKHAQIITAHHDDHALADLISQLD